MSSAAYMEPIAWWCRWLGLTVVRGSPGERSGEFLSVLVKALKRGDSVFLAVDGPAGPAFQAKPGCIHLARDAAVPIVPVAYSSIKGRIDMKRWDNLYTVGEFDRIEVRYGAPIFLDLSEPDSTALARVQKGLEEVCSDSQAEQNEASKWAKASPRSTCGGQKSPVIRNSNDCFCI